jgi:hypothetical protein
MVATLNKGYCIVLYCIVLEKSQLQKEEIQICTQEVDSPLGEAIFSAESAMKLIKLKLQDP